LAKWRSLRRTANGFKLEKVICAVDCGLAVNPNIVAMQMESGIGYGLAAALSGAITLKDGKIEQSNFDDYSVLRMNQMPAIDVHILPSTNKPSGVGEPSTPVIAPGAGECAGGGEREIDQDFAVGRPRHHVGVRTVFITASATVLLALASGDAWRNPQLALAEPRPLAQRVERSGRQG
jgi:hypothetical protein